MYIFLILIIGLILRIVSLNQSLWLDEATSILASKEHSFAGILRDFSPGDFHPPFYYIILKIWINLFGTREIATRSLSLLFALGTIYLVYGIGKRLVSKKVGIFSSLLLSTSSLHIYYSQEVRMYVPATFFASLFVYIFLKVIKNENRKSDFLFLAITGFFLIWTDYYPFFLLVSFLFYLIIFERKNLTKNRHKWLLTFGLIAVLFLPWLPTFIKQFNSGLSVKFNEPLWWKTLGATNIKELVFVPIKFIIGRISFDNKYFYGLISSLSFVIYFSPILLTLKKWKQNLILWFWFGVPIVLSALVGFKIALFSYFRILFIIPAFYLLISCGANLIKNTKVRYLLLTVIILINLTSTLYYLFSPKFHREDWRAATSFIELNSFNENSVAIFVNEGQKDPFNYYSTEVEAKTLDELNNGRFDKIWLMRYVQPIFDPGDEVRKKIEENYRKFWEYDFNGIVVWEYKKI